MSRSRRKAPFIGLTADTDKPFKKQEHKRSRRKEKISCITYTYEEDELDFPHPKEYGNVWASCKDGKIYCDKDWENYKKFMRK